MPGRPVKPDGDPWLERWLGLLAGRSAGAPVLELGCGRGRDTAVLVGAGLNVIGIDRSEKAIEDAHTRVPGAQFHCRDILAPFPLSKAGAVIASLSLHYFPWTQSMELVARIRETLKPGGLLLCRLNSTNDHHFGASGHPEIEPDYYAVDGEPKRFFDEAAVKRLFARGWRTLACEELTIERYEKPKVAWEVVLERV